ncbi:MAG: LysR family transcriptional regulator [Phascolarctobacterium sp.]|nr:LysR family transcriptional regulator [Phascolarctobacterium sp.]
MDLGIYRNFLTIVRYGTITEAAKQNHLASSALVHQLANLENYVGTQLILRGNGKRQIELTDAGKQFYKTALLLCQTEDELLADLRAYEKADKGTLKLGISVARASFFIKNSLIPFSKLYPSIEYDLIDAGPTSHIERSVIDGKIEFAVINSPLTYPRELDVIDRRQENYYAFFKTGYLPEKKKTLTLAEICKYPLYLAKGNSNVLLTMLAERNLSYRIKAHPFLRNHALIWAQEGDGIAIIPQGENDLKNLSDENLRWLPVVDCDLYTEKIIVKGKGRTLSPLAKKFIDFYLSH